MHHTEIDSRVEVMDHDEDLIGGPVEDRPILATAFAPIDGTDVMVPVPQDSPEGYILALTEEQGRQALVVLAEQIGKEEAVKLIQEGR